MALPVILASNIVVDEKDGFAEFVVRLSAPSTQTVSVTYSTTSGSTSLSDYDYHAAGSIAFAPGETIRTVRVAVSDDTYVEGNETFNLNLSAPINATIGTSRVTATIVDNDGIPLPTLYSIEPQGVTVGEGNGSVAFTVTRSDGGSAQTLYASTVQNHGATNIGDYTSLLNQPVVFVVGIGSTIPRCQVTYVVVTGRRGNSSSIWR